MFIIAYFPPLGKQRACCRLPAAAKYLMLVNNIPEIYMSMRNELERKPSTVEVELVRSGDDLFILPSAELFDAIGGAN